MKYAIAAGALALALLPASPVLAQAVDVPTAATQQVSPLVVNPNPGVPQPTVPLPSALSRVLGAGSFLQLCSDPLDPRQFTDECSAASIAE
jgi:hypothetical protein